MNGHYAKRFFGQNRFIAGNKLSLDAGNPLSYSGTGTAWNDLSGSGNNGTLVNGVAYSTANGGVMSFDGVNDYVSTPNSNSLYISGSLSIQVFVKLNALPPALNGNRMYIVAKGTTDQFEWQLSINDFSTNFGKFCFTRYAASTAGGVLNGGSFRGIASTVNAQVGTWTCICVEQDSLSSVPRLYVNNVLNSGASTSVGTMFAKQGTSNVNIGTRMFTERYLLGQGNDINIYDNILSESDRTTNFNTLRGKYGI